MIRPAGIALGSNLGDRLLNLRQARELLAHRTRSSQVLSASLYRTAPVGCPDGSPDFYNTVVEIEYDGSPLDLLRLTQAIQQELGRPETAPRNAPRSIDLDLLYLGDETLETQQLTLPHPRITIRGFVLRPLADIRPDLILPGSQVTIADHLANLSDSEEIAIISTEW